MGPFDNTAIADTVAAVFRSSAFAGHGTVSIGELIAEWIWNLVLRFFGFAQSHPAVGLVFRITLGLALLLVLARIVYGLIARFAPSAIEMRRFDSARRTDWWSTAQTLAAQNDYTGAAHALYLALVGAAARRGLVSLHESKTTGDYLRELRRKPDAIDLPRFTDFTRSYETVIYGIGTCDRDRFATLNSLAATLLNALPPKSAANAAANNGAGNAASGVRP
jgi:uncharacterized membrane protein YhaH (DUF805 family)